MIKGLGTVINALAIIAGGLVGVAGGRFIKQNYQDIVLRATAIAIMFIGAAGAFLPAGQEADGITAYRKRAVMPEYYDVPDTAAGAYGG